MPRSLSWTIVGGGVHGSHLALRLLGESRVTAEWLAVVDPHPRPLDAWRTITDRIGMSYLRSPRVHHIGSDPFDLRDFARTVRGQLDDSPYRGPYRRPSLDLFLRHVDALSELVRLDTAWRTGTARALERTGEGSWVVHTDQGQLPTKRVALALGTPRSEPEADWARRAALLTPDRVRAALDPRGHPPMPGGRAVIVGAGMTGAQWALRLSREGGDVCLVTRNGLRVEAFDTDPGWLGPRFMRGFGAEEDPVERRRAILGARHAGTVTGEVRLELADAQREGRLDVVVGEVVDVDHGSGEHPVRLRIAPTADAAAAKTVSASWVGLATGYSSTRPGGALVDDLVERYRPPMSPCGFPILSHTLEWLPGLFVSGGLAELEIGPVARNIAGARRAASRILGDPPQSTRRDPTPAWVPFPLLASEAAT